MKITVGVTLRFLICHDYTKRSILTILAGYGVEGIFGNTNTCILAGSLSLFPSFTTNVNVSTLGEETNGATNEGCAVLLLSNSIIGSN
jgi:hypothetical protein